MPIARRLLQRRPAIVSGLKGKGPRRRGIPIFRQSICLAYWQRRDLRHRDRRLRVRGQAG